MEHETHTIRHDRLIACSSFVPLDQRAAFFTMLFLGPEALPEEDVSTPFDPEGPKSFPLTIEQAAKLKEKIDKDTWEVLVVTVTDPRDGVGTIDWVKVKEITGVTNWSQFARGRLGGLNRALQKIEGVPRRVQLLWEDEGWVEDGKGDFLSGTMVIDGPAVAAIRAVARLD